MQGVLIEMALINKNQGLLLKDFLIKNKSEFKDFVAFEKFNYE